MPFGLPDPVDVGAAVSAGVQTLVGSATGTIGAVAGQLGDHLAGFIDATSDEWQEFLEGLTTTQLGVMTDTAAFVAQAGDFLAAAPDVRLLDPATTDPSAIADTILHGWSLVLYGADLAAELIDAFDGETGVAEAIRAACPLVGLRIGA